MVQNLKPCDELTQKIEEVVPGLIDIAKNKISARNLTDRFSKALKSLEAKATEYREQPGDGEQVQDVEPNPDDDEDDTDTGRPSLRVPGKVG